MKWKSKSFTCQEHRDSARLLRQIESFGELNESFICQVHQRECFGKRYLWKYMKISPVKSIKKVLLWNVKVEVCVGGGSEGIAAPTPHTEQVKKWCLVRIEILSSLAISDKEFRIPMDNHHLRQRQTSWFSSKIVNIHLRNWLKPSVGKSSDAWKIVCSRRWASPVKNLLFLLLLLLLFC